MSRQCSGLVRCLCVVTGLGILGCSGAVLRSKPAGESPQGKLHFSQGSGIHYFLPMALAEVELTREVSTIEATRRDSAVTETTTKDPQSPDKTEKKTLTGETTKKETQTGQTRFRLDLRIVLHPDPRQLYFVTLSESIFSHDAFVLELTEKGLLKFASARVKDERGTVVAKLGELAVQAARAAAAFDVAPTGAAGPFKMVLDLLDQAQVKNLEDALRRSTDLKWALQVVSLATARGQCSDCEATEGLHFRPLLPYRVSWSIEGQHAGSTVVLLPNEAPVLTIPLTRAAFVEKETKIVFTDGLLTKYEMTKPSQALGFIQVPIDLAKSLVSIPGEMLKVKLEQAQSTRDIERAQGDLLKAQTEAIKAGREKQIEAGK